MRAKVNKGIMLALLAATLYALNLPFSKILLNYLPSTLMAGFLYLGAGIGMVVIALKRRLRKAKQKETSLSKRELPYLVAMVLLDILAPICLLFGLKSTTAANASLLNDFEIVATALIALLIFNEKISSRLWLGIIFITISCTVLSFDNSTSFQFSSGSLLILLSASLWGLENNCTRELSSKDPMQIVLIKGIFSGIGSLVIGLLIGERINNYWSVLCVLLLGFVTYGLSIYYYVYAQRLLGAARTSAYYAIAPFIGTFLSLIVFREIPSYEYFVGLVLMIIGAWLSSNDKPLFATSQKELDSDFKQ